MHQNKLERIPSDELFRRAVACFQVGRYDDGGRCYRSLRARDSSRSLPRTRTWLRDADGGVATFDIRIDREDDCHLYGYTMLAGERLFTARGNATHFGGRRRGQILRSVAIGLSPLGTQFYPEHFAKNTRRS
jgi:hypothetical protein